MLTLHLKRFAAINGAMHKVDERIAVADIRDLADIYTAILSGYFTDIGAKTS